MSTKVLCNCGNSFTKTDVYVYQCPSCTNKDIRNSIKDKIINEDLPNRKKTIVPLDDSPSICPYCGESIPYGVIRKHRKACTHKYFSKLKCGLISACELIASYGCDDCPVPCDNYKIWGNTDCINKIYAWYLECVPKTIIKRRI